MPLAHFPAGSLFQGASGWSRWTALKSAARVRGTPRPTDGKAHEGFARLADEHVFTFAGVCAYTRRGTFGNVALYLSPAAETGATGGATPFDTGALEHGILRPWDSRSLEERWALCASHTHALDRWRASFATWLATHYSAPDRYIESDRGRDDSGLPDRPTATLVELVTHNGSAARVSVPGGRCSDRRAWTWEVRLRDEVSFAHVAALHVPQDLVEDAIAWCTAHAPSAEVVAYEGSPGADTLFAHGQTVVRMLLENPS